MEKKACASFYARYLGGFSLTFGEEKIVINKRLGQKSIQLLLLLLKAGMQGMPWQRLAKLLGSGSEDPRKRHNNLRQQARALRRLIEETRGFPEGRYVIADPGGNYYFSWDYEVETDVGRLDQLYQKIRDGTTGRERKELLQEICRLYTGEFLPALLGEEWATVEGAGYQSVYISCVQELCKILEREKAYPELIKLCSEASRICPYGQWNQIQIECLVKQSRYDEATEIYENTARRFYGELGMYPFPKLQNTDSLGHLRWGDGNIAGSLEGLVDQERRQSPYYCPYPSFVDIYRILSRNIEESHSQATLLLCTMREKKGLEQEMERLQEQLERVMRSSDIYTRYSENQFIALLPETEAEGGQRVVERLRRSWMEEPEPSRAVVEFEISHV